MKIQIKNEPIIFDNKDFQTILIKVYFPFHRNEEDIAKLSLLPSLLNYVCEKYPTEEEFMVACQKNFILSNFCSSTSLGDTNFITFSFCIPDTYTLDKKFIEEQFKIFHEMMYHPKTNYHQFPKKEFERELENIKNGISKVLKNVDSYATIKAKELVDDQNLLSSTIYNHLDQIDLLNENSLYEFYQEKVINNQPMIYLFGNMNHKEITELCKKYLYLREFKNTEIEINQYNYLKVREEVKEIKEQSSFHNSIYMNFYKVKNMQRKDEIYLGLLTELLSSSTSRILQKKLRDESNLVYSTVAFNYSNYGLLGTSSSINKENIIEVKKKIDEAFKELTKIKKIDTLLKRIKEKHRINLIRLQDKKGSLFSDYIRKETGIDITSEEYYKEILPITAKDINKFLKRLQLDSTYFLEEGEHE